MANDSIKAGKLQYGQVYRRKNGNATDPTVWGSSNYDVSSDEMLVQMGFAQVTNGSGTDITFPVAFSEKPTCFVTMATALSTNAWCRFKQNNVTTTQLKDVAVFTAAGSPANTEGVTWLAIGKA